LLSSGQSPIHLHPQFCWALLGHSQQSVLKKNATLLTETLEICFQIQHFCMVGVSLFTSISTNKYIWNKQNKTKSHILEADTSILHFSGCCLHKTFKCVPSHSLRLTAWLLRGPCS